MEDLFEKASFERAKNRIDRLKSLYTHVLIYITVNALTFLGKLIGFGIHPTAWNNCLRGTLLIGLMGLLAHIGLVYGSVVFKKKGWEERKLRELLKKEQEHTTTQN